MKPDEGEVIDRVSTAGEPHLNVCDLRRVERLRRYARLRSCFVTDVWDGITVRGSTLLAPARPADSKGKLFNSLSEDKIDEREDVISWNWCRINSRDLAISKKTQVCKFSAITIW